MTHPFSAFRGNTYNGDRSKPIPVNTVLTLNSSGHVIHGWGANFFHLPHMLTVDKKNNVWLTDVALHQVFKFGPYGGDSKKPLIVLGTPVSVFGYFRRLGEYRVRQKFYSKVA